MTATATFTTLPLNTLRVDDKSNVRTVGRNEVDPHLVASIKAHGLINPLRVRPNGKGHLVFAGGKRLAALQALVKSGDIPADYPTPVSILVDETASTAREVSLAENVAREAMHPVEEYRAYAALHADKENPLDAAAIAKRFGVSEKGVAQRLALGALDDSVLEAWLAGTINFDIARTFTLASSKKQQADALAVVLKGYVNAHNVKQALGLNDNQVGKWLDVIGVEAYEARGGKVTRDLFGDDHVVSDPALVTAMVDELVAATCESLVADGWAWAKPQKEVENYFQYSRVNVEPKPTGAEKKKLKELTSICDDENIDDAAVQEKASEEYDALELAIKLRAFTPQQKAKSGCFVAASPRDGIAIQYGLTAPKAEKQSPAKASGSAKEEPTKNAKPEDAIPGNLITRLAEQLTSAAQATLDKSPNVALAAMLAGFASSNSACKVTSGAHTQRTTFETAFAAALKLSTADLVKELAKIAAKSVNLVEAYAKTPALENKSFKALCEAIEPKAFNTALREKFDAKDYFASASRTTIVAAVAEAMGSDHAASVAKMDKAAAVKFAAANLPKLKWLPKQLRVSSYDGPVSAAKSKAKASAKKAKR